MDTVDYMYTVRYPIRNDATLEDVKAQLTQILVKWIQQTNTSHGLAMHNFLSGLITRADIRREPWTRHFPDDESYEEATTAIVVAACNELELDDSSGDGDDSESPHDTNADTKMSR